MRLTRAQFRLARGGAAAVFAATCAVAMTSAQDDRAITACAGPNGQLRLVASADDCRKGESPVQWNAAGPQGEQGPAGAQGPEGAQGPQGATGPAGPGFAGDQHFTVGAGDFRSIAPNTVVLSLSGGRGGSNLSAPSPSPILAGVHLPEGAAVYNLSARVFDNSGINPMTGQPIDLVIELVEQDLDTGSIQVLGTVSPTGQSMQIMAASASASATIRNDSHAYFIRVTPTTPGWNQSLQIMGATVSYRMPLPIH